MFFPEEKRCINIKVHFITHSCFLIESKSCYLLFDYFIGDLPQIKQNKPLFSFSSHGHSDHFSSNVFKLSDKFSNCYFILSDDIDKNNVPSFLLSKVTFVMANKEYDFLDIKIKTLRSTDKGVAFCLEVDGKEIYHAGDLNDWAWDESSKSENDDMHKAYLKEIKKISNNNFYLAFVPLDSRQEEYFDLGMLGFLQECRAEHVFPMHMCELFSTSEVHQKKSFSEVSIIELFKEKHPNFAQKLININSDNQSFEI